MHCIINGKDNISIILVIINKILLQRTLGLWRRCVQENHDVFTEKMRQWFYKHTSQHFLNKHDLQANHL